MNLSAKGLTFIQGQEGYSPKVYLDVARNPTGGWGHLLSREERMQWPVGTELSESDWTHLLESDVEDSEDMVNRMVTVPLSQGQFDALVDFTFNEGGGNLERSTLLTELNAGNYQGAADQFKRWDWAGGSELSDLRRRRLSERALFQGEDA